MRGWIVGHYTVVNKKYTIQRCEGWGTIGLAAICMSGRETILIISMLIPAASPLNPFLASAAHRHSTDTGFIKTHSLPLR